MHRILQNAHSNFGLDGGAAKGVKPPESPTSVLSGKKTAVPRTNSSATYQHFFCNSTSASFQIFVLSKNHLLRNNFCWKLACVCCVSFLSKQIRISFVKSVGRISTETNLDEHSTYFCQTCFVLHSSPPKETKGGATTNREFDCPLALRQKVAQKVSFSMACFGSRSFLVMEALRYVRHRFLISLVFRKGKKTLQDIF